MKARAILLKHFHVALCFSHCSTFSSPVRIFVYVLNRQARENFVSSSRDISTQISHCIVRSYLLRTHSQLTRATRGNALKWFFVKRFEIFTSEYLEFSGKKSKWKCLERKYQRREISFVSESLKKTCRFTRELEMPLTRLGSETNFPYGERKFVSVWPIKVKINYQWFDQNLWKIDVIRNQNAKKFKIKTIKDFNFSKSPVFA